ncbi:MAG: queuosine precursor transporter [Bacteriovoracaceae bacterium]|nr:queuosine precursor transporter [Bacteriovoracaceae bacterium]
MTNELLWLSMLLVNFFAILFAYKKFGKIGLYVWIPISILMANIQVVLLVDLFGFGTTLGNIVYASGFLVTDILSENHGEQDAKRAVSIGFFSIVSMTIIMQISVLFRPSEISEGVQNFQSVKTIFSFMPRLVVSGMVAYYISQRHDVWAFAFWKRKFKGEKHLWIRNNLSTMSSQLIDNAIFSILAFWGVFPTHVILEIFWTTYVMKFVVAAIDTPFLYFARYLARKDMIGGLDISDKKQNSTEVDSYA